MSIRWNCETSGCYKDKCIPDWGFLQGAFPRGCRPTDIDGIVELDGNFLLLEWKNGGEIPAAQRTLFRRITELSSDIIAVVLFGDTEKSTVECMQVVKNGEIGPKEACTTEEFVDKCRRWGKRTESSKEASISTDELCKFCGIEKRAPGNDMCDSCATVAPAWEDFDASEVR